MRRQPHPEAPTLSDLVDDVERFRAHDVHRRPRFSPASVGALATTGDGSARRRDPSRFARPEQLWADLLERSGRRPSFRLVDHGATTAPSQVTRPARIGNRDLNDLAAPNRVIDGYRRGATVALQGLHLTDPSLARAANNLALELDQPVQINAYLSPESARGLDVHFDYHDVFVVQLEGTKHWQVWAPTDRTRDPIGGKHVTPSPRREELGDPILDLVLEPGDVLYLPRGHPHLAETTDRSSAHLTVGLLSITWHRVVRRAVDDAIAAGRLRGSIPLSTLGGGAGGESVPHEEPDLASLSLDLASVPVRRWVAGEIWRRQAATRLRPLAPVAAESVDDELSVTPGPLITLSRRGARSELFVGDRTISMPDEAHPFLAALLRTDGAFRRCDLDGLDDRSSRVVTHRLLDEGILAASATGSPP